MRGLSLRKDPDPSGSTWADVLALFGLCGGLFGLMALVTLGVAF